MDKIIVTFDGEGRGDGGANGFGYGIGYGGFAAGNYVQSLFGSSYASGDGEGCGYGDSYGGGAKQRNGEHVNLFEKVWNGTGCGLSAYGDKYGGGFDKYRILNRVDITE